MTRVPDYPQLRQFFQGYLHEDFVQEHGSPEAALRAFEAISLSTFVPVATVLSMTTWKSARRPSTLTSI